MIADRRTDCDVCLLHHPLLVVSCSRISCSSSRLPSSSPSSLLLLLLILRPSLSLPRNADDAAAVKHEEAGGSGNLSFADDFLASAIDVHTQFLIQKVRQELRLDNHCHASCRVAGMLDAGDAGDGEQNECEVAAAGVGSETAASSSGSRLRRVSGGGIGDAASDAVAGSGRQAGTW